jgi:hypothetical protein
MRQNEDLEQYIDSAVDVRVGVWGMGVSNCSFTPVHVLVQSNAQIYFTRLVRVYSINKHTKSPKVKSVMK